MKTFGILFIFMFTAAFAPAKGHSNPKTTSLENLSEKIYVEPSRLYFSDEGIFLKTCFDEWKPIGHICYDVRGYFIKINDLDFDIEIGIGIDNNRGNEQEFYWDDAGIIQCGSRVSKEPKKWQCPYCHRWWLMGEKCRYEGCPTNQWKKNKEKS